MPWGISSASCLVFLAFTGGEESRSRMLSCRVRIARDGILKYDAHDAWIGYIFSGRENDVMRCDDEKVTFSHKLA